MPRTGGPTKPRMVQITLTLSPFAVSLRLSWGGTAARQHLFAGRDVVGKGICLPTDLGSFCLDHIPP